MTYKDCLLELEKHNLKEDFCLTFEPMFNKSFLERLKNTDKIYSEKTLIRSALSLTSEENTDIYKKWVLILQYLMVPEFSRQKI